MPTERETAIVNHPEAVGREALAQHLADKTSMPVEAAVAALRAAGRDTTAAAALGGAATARKLLGLPVDQAADARIASRLAGLEGAGDAEAARKAAAAERFQAEYAEGRRAAAAILGKKLLN